MQPWELSEARARLRELELLEEEAFQSSLAWTDPPSMERTRRHPPFDAAGRGGYASNASWQWLFDFLWNNRAIWLSLLCILYVRWSHTKDRMGNLRYDEEEEEEEEDESHHRSVWHSFHNSLQYGVDVLWNTLGTALDYSRALWQMIREYMRQYDAFFSVPLIHTQPRQLDSEEDDDDDVVPPLDRNVLRSNRISYYFHGTPKKKIPRHRASSLPDLDEGDDASLIPEAYSDALSFKKDFQCSSRHSSKEEAMVPKKWPSSSFWKRGDYSTRPLAPAFGRPEDYPATWWIYHPVLRVVTKESADVYDQQHSPAATSVTSVSCHQDGLLLETNGTLDQAVVHERLDAAAAAPLDRATLSPPQCGEMTSPSETPPVDLQDKEALVVLADRNGTVGRQSVMAT